MTSPTSPRAAHHPALALAGILLIAASLRAPITVVGPLVVPIRESLGLGAAQAGLLTTLPLLAFALVSPVAAPCAARFGLERTLLAALALMCAGIVLRSAGPAWALYAGTGLTGGAIAVGNVLLPSLLKRDFPLHMARLTAGYAATMIAAAALASAVAVPLAEAWGGGWTRALAAVAVLPLLAALPWLVPARPPADAAPRPSPAAQRPSVWRAPLAWQVAAYLGLTCLIHFAAIAWLPAILQEAGASGARAGALHGWMQLAGAAPALALVPLLQRLPDQRWIAFASPALGACGLAGLLARPEWAALWTFAFGMGMGASLVLSLAFVGLRAGSPQVAASLSGMAQCIGYLLAAVGPTLAGSLREWSGRWSLPLGACIALCIAMCALGLSVGRAGHIDGTPVRRGREGPQPSAG